MLIPRFSLRSLLGLITVSSVFFLLLSYAVRGQLWAIATTIAIGSLLVVALFHAAIFLLALAASGIVRSFKSSDKPRSPFAADSHAPQIINPVEPE